MFDCRKTHIQVANGGDSNMQTQHLLTQIIHLDPVKPLDVFVCGQWLFQYSPSSPHYLWANTCHCWARSFCVPNHHFFNQTTSAQLSQLLQSPLFYCISPGFHIICAELHRKGGLKCLQRESHQPQAEYCTKDCNYSFVDMSHMLTYHQIIYTDHARNQ